MNIEEAIRKLNDIKNTADLLEFIILGCETSISYDDECGWILCIDYPISDDSTTNLSTYMEEFKSITELDDHLRMLFIGANIAKKKEV